MGLEILSIGHAADESFLPLHIGQRTRLLGKPGMFMVVGVDPQGRTADVIASAGITPVLRHVPLTQFRPLGISHADDANERILPFPS